MSAIPEVAGHAPAGLDPTDPRGGVRPPREHRDLRQQLVALVDADRRMRLEQEGARARERADLAALRAPFESTVSPWMERAVSRLRLLLELLPSPGTIERASHGARVTASFPPTADYPVAASLSIEITPVNRYRTARVAIEPLLIPMLQGHPQSSVREFAIDDSGVADVDRHLDQGVLAFAHTYLHVRDSASPYQACRRSY